MNISELLEEYGAEVHNFRQFLKEIKQKQGNQAKNSHYLKMAIRYLLRIEQILPKIELPKEENKEDEYQALLERIESNLETKWKERAREQ